VVLLPNPATKGFLPTGKFSRITVRIWVLRKSGCLSIISRLNELTRPSGLVKTGPNGSLYSSELQQMYTLFDEVEEKRACLLILNYLITVILNFVEHIDHAVMNPSLVQGWHELSEHICFGDSSVNI
jgi:hypothetical protein